MKDVNLKHRYWVVRIDQYYPSGFDGDISFTSDDLAEAREWLNSIDKAYRFDHESIFDADNREFVNR